MRLLVNLIRVTWSRTRTQYAVLKFSIEFVYLTVPMASAEFHGAVAHALTCVGRQNVTSEKQPRRSSCSSCTPVIAARGVFAWFPAGYGKPSCYQLLAFVYDFKLKRTRSRGTERNVVCAIAGVDRVVYIFLLRMKSVHVHW